MLTPPTRDQVGGRTRPTQLADLRTPERRLLRAIQELAYGRIEFLKIEHGEPVLDPWPLTVRDVKFGSADPSSEIETGLNFQLKKQVAELFEYIRSVESSVIRVLEIKNGLPFSMKIEQRSIQDGGSADA
jgi:hypothetical protein